MSNSVAKNPVPALSHGTHTAHALYDASGGRKYLNREERHRVLQAMQGLDADKALFALTLAWTGARVSEVLALTPTSFQIGRGIVAFRTLKRRRFVMREVPIPAELAGAIENRYAVTRALADPVACRERLWPWCRETAWRIIKVAMADSGLAGRQASPRGLRHGFGVGTVQAGVPLNLVQRWLGHARISTTAIYTDASGPEEMAFAERFWRSG